MIDSGRYDALDPWLTIRAGDTRTGHTDGSREPDGEGMLSLLQLSPALEIDGDVTVTVEEVCDLGRWVALLPEPRVLAWRDSDLGDRHLHITSRHESSPVWGVVTVRWRTSIRHSFWSALLRGEDLACGTERELTGPDVMTALRRTRIPDRS